jgi:DNA-binding transcriptional LysR family regulator
MSESLSEIIPWTMKQGKELMEVKPEYRLRANDFLLIKQLLLSDFGIAYVPSITVLEEISNGSLVRVLSDWALMERELYLVYPSDRHLSPKVRALIEFIYQKVTPQAPWSTTDSE